MSNLISLGNPRVGFAPGHVAAAEHSSYRAMGLLDGDRL